MVQDLAIYHIIYPKQSVFFPFPPQKKLPLRKTAKQYDEHEF
jgi:hypothetical protein